MGKALLFHGPNGGIPSGNEIALFRSGSNSTESNTQVVTPVAGTIDGLRVYISTGGSGTNNFRFRKNGANGNELATRSGPGFAEDTVNSDTLAAADNFNIAYTDTGTNSGYPYVAANIELSSGHGNLHAAMSYVGVVWDVASSTRYAPISGDLIADGVAAADIANVQWENRSYTSCDAISIQIAANARTNDSTFSLNVNGSDVGTPVTIGAGLTGTFSATGLGISLSPGDLVCYSVTLGSGVEDLTIRVMCGAFKAPAASEIWAVAQTGVARAASATANYYGLGGELFDFAAGETATRCKIGFAARCANLRCYVSANTYSGDATLKLMVNGTARITTTITAGATGWIRNGTDTYDISATDECCYEVDEGSSGSITFRSMGVSFDPIPTAPISNGWMWVS
jgi:hypothetical protein